MDVSRLRELLDYDPETGEFIYLTTRGSARKGTRKFGAANKNGYLGLGVDGKIYAAHRLAWMLFYGEDPPAQIDHINGDRQDNRITNLRSASPLVNAGNVGVRKNSPFGVPGVTACRGKYKVTATRYGVSHHLGYFDTLEEAVAVRHEAEEELQLGADRPAYSRQIYPSKPKFSRETDPLYGVKQTVPGRWMAYIHRDGKQKYLGSFGSPEEARAAVSAAKTSTL